MMFNRIAGQRTRPVLSPTGHHATLFLRESRAIRLIRSHAGSASCFLSSVRGIERGFGVSTPSCGTVEPGKGRHVRCPLQQAAGYRVTESVTKGAA